LFQSSGNLTADRRYTFAQDLAKRGDFSAAADLYAQAIELAPEFASAWFALGEMREKLGQRDDAIAAFRQARILDPRDRHGAQLHLMRLGAAEPGEMPADYVRTLFDQYAARFDSALTQGLAYRAPALLVAAVSSVCGQLARPLNFRSALDLGCGTGLGGAAFRTFSESLVGVDLSPGMIEQARGKNLYDELVVGDILPFLAERPAAHFDLVFAADVFAYFADLQPLAAAGARVLMAGGLFAFTVETHADDGVMLGEKLRYRHGAAHVATALGETGLALLSIVKASGRHEAGVPVQGLVVVARRP